MFKTKLQELCHQKRWGLPKYSGLKDGPDHEPRFTASVSVNGSSFHCPHTCRSSKQAYNAAAKLAYLHFTSPSPSRHLSAAPVASAAPTGKGPKVEETDHNVDGSKSSSVEDVKELGIGSSSAKPNVEGLKVQESCQSDRIQSDPLGITVDEGFKKTRRYKNLLQNYAKWKHFDLPLYFNESEGSPHALNYKGTVTIAGRTFQSSEVFNTPEEAENAAAKAALLPLLLDSFQKNGSSSYKNLLLELTQKEDLFMPKYKTTQSGSPHSSTFLSVVEVEGETYRGKVANSKKQAEQNAAMVAYTALIERFLGANLDINSSNIFAREALGFTGMVDSPQKLKHEYRSTSLQAIEREEHDEEDEVQEVASLDVWMEGSSSPEKSSPSSAMSKNLDLSANAISDGNTRNRKGTSSYLLCNRVRVYPYYPDTEFPEGITVLPISENKWVAVSLEFPKETDN